jgi:hypothetical protein
MKRDAGKSTHEQRPRPAGELASDQGGAIVIVGTFMAIFLTAALFFIMGTGEAIVYRERVQDAADAVAFSSAGVHARGMNLIVLINMIMAAILAVLVALKMLQAMTVILTAVACIICAIPFGQWACPACTAGVQFSPKLQSAISKYQQVVKKVLPVLSKLQVVVAVTTPYVALAKSPGVAKKYEPLATGGLMLSPSMVPCVPGGCDKGKIGLPVQEDSYGKLCEEAGKMAVDIAFFWMTGALSVLKAGLQKFAGFLAGSFPGYFCNGGGISGGAAGLEGANASLETLAKQACQAEESGKREAYKLQNGGDDEGFEFDMADCTEKKQKQFKSGGMGCKKVENGECTEQEYKPGIDDMFGDGAGDALQGSMNVSKMTPKKVYTGAKHGGFYFQTFGFANAEADWPRRTDKGILIATKGGGMNVPSNMFTAMRFAQAEFYFDSPEAWDKVKDQAMWEMSWRARLRRIRPMGPDIAGFSFKYATGKLTDLIGAQITKKLMDGDIFNFILGQSTFDFAQDWLKKQAGNLGKKLDKKIDGKLQFTSWEIIH